MAHWSKSEQRKYLNYGAPGEIRTPGLLVRSQALYPTELRARKGREYYHIIARPPFRRQLSRSIERKRQEFTYRMAEREGFEPSMGF